MDRRTIPTQGKPQVTSAGTTSGELPGMQHSAVPAALLELGWWLFWASLSVLGWMGLGMAV